MTRRAGPTRQYQSLGLAGWGFGAGLEDLSLDEFMGLNRDELWLFALSRPGAEGRSPLQALRMAGFEVAFNYLTREKAYVPITHEGSYIENLRLGMLQNKLDEATLWLMIGGGDFSSAEQLTLERAQVEKGYSVFKIIRGMRCNYNCMFCLEQTGDQAQMDSINANSDIRYTMDDLLLGALYARMAFGISEGNFSGGEPLVNNPGRLAEEIRLVRTLRYPQITLLTNGSLLSEKLIDDICEAGLTNLTISLHTGDATNYHMLTRIKDGRAYHPHIVEMVRYAACRPGLTVRVNAAKMRDYTESVRALVDFTTELGIDELTINEMIKANAFSKEQYIPISPDELGEGFVKTYESEWGLTVYRRKDGSGPSVAICRFGSENFSEEQTKDLYLLPDGTVSPNLFNSSDGLLVL